MNIFDKSLRFFNHLHDSNRTNIVAFSGGKDSIVLYHMAKRTGLEFEYHYYNTTIDPPGHIQFIRKNYPDVEILQPKYSFYELVALRGLPTRHRRFCCQELKEYDGRGCKVFEGVRISESVKREKRLSTLKEPEQCDTRVKGKTHAYPIMYMSDSDVWDYIKKYDLPYPDVYNDGFSRLGCVGCPLANQKQRIYEYQKYPKYAHAVIKAIRKNIENGKNLSKFFNDEYEAFFWWLSERSIREHTATKNGLFKTDYKLQILKTLQI